MPAAKGKAQDPGGDTSAAAGSVASLGTGPAGAHQDQIAIAVTNTAPATMAATASPSTLLTSFRIGRTRIGKQPTFARRIT